jgi:hypothetical protein
MRSEQVQEFDRSDRPPPKARRDHKRERKQVTKALHLLLLVDEYENEDLENLMHD